MRSFLPLAALCIAALCSSACVSALGETPELNSMNLPSSGANTDPLTLRARAETMLETAASTESVDQARELFLQAATLDASCTDCLLGALRAYSWLIEHESASARRKELAEEAVGVGQLCVKQAGDNPECRYRLALAVGQQARERPSTASDGLKVMIGLLDELIGTDPGIDHAGPDRVLALVLLRAPGWPAGPGDAEAALEHARAAASRFPAYPPNQLVLGEALGENGLKADAEKAFNRALRLAKAHTGPEADSWVVEAGNALAQSH